MSLLKTLLPGSAQLPPRGTHTSTAISPIASPVPFTGFRLGPPVSPSDSVPAFSYESSSNQAGASSSAPPAPPMPAASASPSAASAPASPFESTGLPIIPSAVIAADLPATVSPASKPALLNLLSPLLPQPLASPGTTHERNDYMNLVYTVTWAGGMNVKSGPRYSLSFLCGLLSFSLNIPLIFSFCFFDSQTASKTGKSLDKGDRVLTTGVKVCVFRRFYNFTRFEGGFT